MHGFGSNRKYKFFEIYKVLIAIRFKHIHMAFLWLFIFPEPNLLPSALIMFFI
ncbi:hypothetical protein Hanom_Chr12g01164431 [Helianthus anomalus]